jgi:hypothetical protein
MFHTDRDEEAAKADGVRQASILMQGCMCTYCPNQNVSLTQHPSDFPASVVDQYEISGLTRMFHTDRDEEDAKADEVRQAMKFDDGCMSPYCPRKTSRSTQRPYGFPTSVVDWYALFELTRILETSTTIPSSSLSIADIFQGKFLRV